jgi:hypothetical protein
LAIVGLMIESSCSQSPVNNHQSTTNHRSKINDH